MTASDPLIGTEVAGYLVEERLGRGAVGVVYRAKQLSLKRTVALKRLSPARSSGQRLEEGREVPQDCRSPGDPVPAEALLQARDSDHGLISALGSEY